MTPHRPDPALHVGPPTTAPGPPLVDVVGLRAWRGRASVLDACSLRLAAGERLAVLGASGVGKSTLLRVLAGLTSGITVQAERLRVAGFTPVGQAGRAPPASWWGRRVGVAMQGAPLDPLATVGRQLAQLRRTYGLTASEPELAALLRRCGLPAAERFLTRHAHELSGGERSRVGLAFALAGEPALLLADEPTAGLDPERTREIGAWLGRHCAEHGVALVLVTHDEDLATMVCERTLVLRGLGSDPTAGPEAT